MEAFGQNLSSQEEQRRLAALATYGILGTAAEEAYLRLARLAQQMFQVPGVILGFVGERRVYHKVHLGLEQHSYPRAQSLCARAAFSQNVFYLPDVAENPEVAALQFSRQNGVRFFAGVPLKDDAGQVLGAFSVFDTRPREFGSVQLAQLSDLAAAVLELLSARRQKLEARQLREQRVGVHSEEPNLPALLEVLPYYAFTADVEGNLRFVNQTLRRTLGLRELPKKLTDLVPRNEHDALRVAFNESLASSQASLETQLLGRGGQLFPVSLGLFTHSERGNEGLSVSALGRAVEARQQRERREQQRTEVLELTARGAPLPAVLLQLSHFLEANCGGTRVAVLLLQEGKLSLEAAPTLPSAFARTLDGLPPSSAGGSGLAVQTGQRVLSTDIRHDPLWRDLRYFALQQGFVSCWSEPILNDQGTVLGVFSLFLSEHREPLEIELRLLREAAGLAAIAVQRQQLYLELERAARFDPLTGLPNRRRLAEYMTWAIGQATQKQGVMSVMILDLDDFKQVNDSLGHTAGDSLLKEVALRLEASLPRQASVARSGGDEFVFVLPLEHRDDAAKVAFEITRALQKPFILEGRSFNVGASIGISLYPDDATDPETLLKTADSAMYAAKADRKVGNKQGYRRYLPEMTAALDAQLRLEDELRRALASHELRLFVQPRFDIARSAFTSFEALVRWQHPERGLLTPASFLPGAEEAGLMPELDRWVLHQVIEYLAHRHPLVPAERLSCNVSAASFQSASFLSSLEANLSAHNVPASRLELEITENLLMQDLQGAAEQLHQLKRDFPGMRVAIDDFGSGYSSLAYLRQLPVDTLKIDRAFIRDLDHSSARQQRTALAVIRTVVALGRDLDFRIVAEGAETEAQLKMLIALGVDEVQGYLLARPRPIEDEAREPQTLPHLLSDSF